MKNLIYILILSIILAASSAQASTITGWAHTEHISADVYSTYSASDSTLLLTVTNHRLLLHILPDYWL